MRKAQHGILFNNPGSTRRACLLFGCERGSVALRDSRGLARRQDIWIGGRVFIEVRGGCQDGIDTMTFYVTFLLAIRSHGNAGSGTRLHICWNCMKTRLCSPLSTFLVSSQDQAGWSSRQPTPHPVRHQQGLGRPPPPSFQGHTNTTPYY